MRGTSTERCTPGDQRSHSPSSPPQPAAGQRLCGADASRSGPVPSLANPIRHEVAEAIASEWLPVARDQYGITPAQPRRQRLFEPRVHGYPQFAPVFRWTIPGCLPSTTSCRGHGDNVRAPLSLCTSSAKAVRAAVRSASGLRRSANFLVCPGVVFALGISLIRAQGSSRRQPRSDGEVDEDAKLLLEHVIGRARRLRTLRHHPLHMFGRRHLRGLAGSDPLISNKVLDDEPIADLGALRQPQVLGAREILLR